MKLYLLSGLLYVSVNLAIGQVVAPQISLTPVATGFNEPVDIANAGDERLFIVEQDGYIRITDTAGNTLPLPFLDIDARVNSGASERGLLGLAFSPTYADDGRFYVNYTNASGATVIARFEVSPSDSNLADPASEEILLTITQPFTNHNGGCLKFGPDGYLYIGTGDGGSAGDPGNRSQNPLTLLGKMLRIDVSGSSGYSIPADNPYAGSMDTLPEIWHLGLRNPWRYSFDRETGDLWIADVGQNTWEEINFQPAGSAGGENWGWRCFEGPAAFISSGCGTFDTYDAPVFVYDHGEGFSVTGGSVYRGERQFTLAGTDAYEDFAHYVLADYVTGNSWTVQRNACSGEWVSHESTNLGFGISTFGEAVDGELFAANLVTGVISRVEDDCSRLHPVFRDVNYDIVDFEAEVWLTGEPVGTYTWFGPSSGCDTLGVTTDTRFPIDWALEGQDVTAEVAYPDGCKVRYTGQLPIVDGLEPEQLAGSWTIAPQPASNGFLWSTDQPLDGGTLTVYDVAGREMSSQGLRPKAGQQQAWFDTAGWPQGMYVLRWTNGQQQAARSVLIQP